MLQLNHLNSTLRPFLNRLALSQCKGLQWERAEIVIRTLCVFIYAYTQVRTTKTLKKYIFNFANNVLFVVVLNVILYKRKFLSNLCRRGLTPFVFELLCIFIIIHIIIFLDTREEKYVHQNGSYGD